MKGHVYLKNTPETLSIIIKGECVVSSITKHDLECRTVMKRKFNWKKLKFESHEQKQYIQSFLWQHRNSVITFLDNLKNMVASGNDVYLSLTSYNELVKLSHGDLSINTYWLLNY
ncbi:MAG: hypothetical protein [Caudoviricetes sp.]|nr:MAG: hypothetical protein [Caudoviricetes sp.]